MPGVDRSCCQVRNDEPNAQPPGAEARHEDDERHDHHDSQAEEVPAGSEAMLRVTKYPV